MVVLPLQTTNCCWQGEQTVTTASKKAQKASEVPAAVTVITEEDIRASGAPTLIDLLRSVPGVDVNGAEPGRRQCLHPGIQLSVCEQTAG